MKKLLATLIVLSLPLASTAQAAGQSLASTLDVYAFPEAGQDSSQQSQDEAQCYSWAEENTGTDPFDLEKQAESQQAQTEAEMAAAENAGAGSGARGALRGAAAGAVVGEIANDDAGEGAAWGAGLGALRGRRQGHQAQAEAQHQAAAKGQQQAEVTAEELENFKKAFSVCLEAKEYLVKY